MSDCSAAHPVESVCEAMPLTDRHHERVPAQRGVCAGISLVGGSLRHGFSDASVDAALLRLVRYLGTKRGEESPIRVRPRVGVCDAHRGLSVARRRGSTRRPDGAHEGLRATPASDHRGPLSAGSPCLPVGSFQELGITRAAGAACGRRVAYVSVRRIGGCARDRNGTAISTSRTSRRTTASIMITTRAR